VQLRPASNTTRSPVPKRTGFTAIGRRWRHPPASGSSPARRRSRARF
jgi:hypothetical protein